MKIRDNNNILLLLERYEGVLVDWEQYRERYDSLYKSVYQMIDIKQKYKLFTRTSNPKRLFSCYSSNEIENFIGRGKVIEEESDVYYIL